MSKIRFSDDRRFDNLGYVDITMPDEAKPNNEKVISNAVFTLAIKDGKMYINNVKLHDKSNKTLERVFPDGLAYIGVTVNTQKDVKGNCPTITILEVNGEKPTGDDARGVHDCQHEGCCESIEVDPETIPFGTPAFKFDATFQYKDSLSGNDLMPSGGNCKVGLTADEENYLVKVDGDSHYWVFRTKWGNAYNGSHFPMVAFLLKNFCTCDLNGNAASDECLGFEEIVLRYMAGNTELPDNSSMTMMRTVPVNPVDENGNIIDPDNHYLLAYAYIDDEENYRGRIHGFRVDIKGHNSINNPDGEQYEIVWGGAFATPLSILRYIYDEKYDDQMLMNSFIAHGLYPNPEIPCELPYPPQNVPSTTTTVSTEKPTENTTENTTEASTVTEENKNGCTSTVSVAAVIATSIVGIGVTLKKKMNNKNRAVANKNAAAHTF